MTSASSESARLRLEVVDHREDRIRRMRVLLVVALVAVIVAVVAYFLRSGTSEHRLRVSAGSAHGHRHALATVLQRTSEEQHLEIVLEPTSGSRETLAELVAGNLDVGLVQGGLPRAEGVQQVAVLMAEPLHLLVRPELLEGGLRGLAGRRLNLSTSSSGTRTLAVQVLSFAGLAKGDYVDSSLGYGELRETDDLPDGVFAVAPMPSEVADFLVHERGYQLMPLPYGPALALRDRSIEELVVPVGAYGASPVVPSEPLHTVATRMAVVARADVPTEAVTRLLEAIYDGRFLQEAELANLQPDDVRRFRELPLHEGAKVYLDRNRPMLDGEFIEGLENLRSFIFSGLIAIFLLWRWYESRQIVGWEGFLDRVTRVELDALETAESSTLTGEGLLAAEIQLSRIKAEALEQYAAGRIRGDEQMSGFLVHVTDVRNLLRRLAATFERRGGHSETLHDEADRPASSRVP